MRNSIASRIKELRHGQCMTLMQFALMSGLNRSYVADIEKSKRNFGIDALNRVAHGFGISYQELFMGM